ncbi:MAG: methyltransferase, partial [Cyanobacteriota bacterium]|nr:methyltransferase [Cyanobacteriota bacterium]
MHLPNQLPPETIMKQMASGYWISQCVYVAAKLGIADLLTDTPKHCDQLAATTNTNSDTLYRLLRALASLGVFAETESRCFQLTPLAECLRGDVPHSAKDMAIMLGEKEHYQSWGDLFYSVQTGESAFEHLHGMSFFQYIQQNPATGEVFHRTIAERSPKKKKAIAASYDFSGIRTLIDVGGGADSLIAAILQDNPHLKGMLFDSPQIIKKAPAILANAGVSDRCQLVAGDFFASIPLGGDACLLKQVLRNWDEERAIAILRNCRRAMKRQGRVLVIERLIAPGNEPTFSKLLDLEMLVTNGGKERSEAEYGDLLNAAGFQLTKIVPT